MCDDLYVYTLPIDRYAKLNEKIEEFKDNPEVKKKYELWKRQEELMELYEIKRYLSDAGFIINDSRIENGQQRLEEIILKTKERDGYIHEEFINELKKTIKRFNVLSK